MAKRKASSPGSPAPLLSWDIFMENYRRRMKLGDDLQQLRQLIQEHQWKLNWNELQQMLLQKGKVIVITTLSQHIVFATSNIIGMTGYGPEEVAGKQPAIFQGRDTSLPIRAQIRACIKNLEPFHVVLTNYRKNGQPYECEIQGFPIYNRQGKPVNFIAFESEAA